MLYATIFVVAAAALGAKAQTLYDAMSKFPELSNFTAFIANNPNIANNYFGNTSAYPITFLAPNNDAFMSLQAKFGANMSDIPADTLLQIIQYHTMVSNLTKSDFNNNGGGQGLTVPTMLNSVNNNRSVGISMAARYGGATKAGGQVVFVKGDSGSPGRLRLMSRQDNPNGGQPANTVRSGLSSNVGITAIDGVWNGGIFHIIDGLLTPPTLCSTTIRSAGLSSLDLALNRTQLWNSLDSTNNITCLGPNNAAFSNSGSPDSKLNTTALSGALLFHTLPQVAYSDYLYDGQEFKSLQNMTVRVKIVGSGSSKTIYFNNAKVLNANVL